MSSLKDTPSLTPELESALRCRINPVYVGTLGTESHERAALLGEIDRLRAEVAELAQQRGDLAARVLELEQRAQTVEVWRGERKVTVYPGVTVLRIWGVNIDTEMSEAPATLDSVQAAFDWLYLDSRTENVASDSQPSEQTR